jgi:hypothetical protein
MTTLPPMLLEGSNGAIAIALVFVLLLQSAYLVATAIRISETRQSFGGWPAVVRSVYYQLKPVIALTVAVAGLVTRSGPIWWQRFAGHHGLATIPDFWFQVTLHVVGTMAAVIGLLCWVRVTIPSYLGFRTWLVLVALTGLVFASPWLADYGIAASAWTIDAADRLRVF